MALAQSEAFGHCLDAVVRSRQLVPDRERFADHGGEACVDFSLGAFLNDEVLLAGASQLRLYRHDDGIEIRLLARSFRLQRRGDLQSTMVRLDSSH